MKIIKPPEDFHAGAIVSGFILCLEKELRKNPKQDYCLDLSDVLFMDSFSFRAVFNNLPRLKKVIPPKNKHVIERYNEWLDSKKGLCKNWE